MPRILVVEDEAPNLEIIVRLLTLKGYEVLSACDGPQGVALAVTAKPDLILMDLALPVPGDGLQATRQIRSHAGMAAVPILALTASAMAGDQELARQAGCNDLQSKPYDFARLLGKIQSLLASREAS